MADGVSFELELSTSVIRTSACRSSMLSSVAASPNAKYDATASPSGTVVPSAVEFVGAWIARGKRIMLARSYYPSFKALNHNTLRTTAAAKSVVPPT